MIIAQMSDGTTLVGVSMDEIQVGTPSWIEEDSSGKPLGHRVLLVFDESEAALMARLRAALKLLEGAH